MIFTEINVCHMKVVLSARSKQKFASHGQTLLPENTVSPQILTALNTLLLSKDIFIVSNTTDTKPAIDPEPDPAPSSSKPISLTYHLLGILILPDNIVFACLVSPIHATSSVS
jgi:hypothetical protein